MGIIPDCSVRDLFYDGKWRKRRGKPKEGIRVTPPGHSISDRPESAGDRSESGYWEGIERSCLDTSKKRPRIYKPNVRFVEQRSCRAFYYTHAYRACERGANENHNGFLRRFLPRDTLKYGL
jgi:IS30 family transposase